MERYESEFINRFNHMQKILRIKQIENNKGKTLVSEGIDANYQDMINYSVFALIHLPTLINYLCLGF